MRSLSSCSAMRMTRFRRRRGRSNCWRRRRRTWSTRLRTFLRSRCRCTTQMRRRCRSLSLMTLRRSWSIRSWSWAFRSRRVPTFWGIRSSFMRFRQLMRVLTRRSLKWSGGTGMINWNFQKGATKICSERDSLCQTYILMSFQLKAKKSSSDMKLHKQALWRR